MKLEKLKEIASKMTPGRWKVINSGFAFLPYKNSVNMIGENLDGDREAVEAMANHFDALLDLVEACKHNPCRHTVEHDVCDVCDAIAKLEEVK